MKTLFTSLLALSSLGLIAQNTSTWLGGAAGAKSDWNTARNWSTGAVPTTETHVVVKPLNTGNYAEPVIRTAAEAASIAICAGATLTVSSKGILLVDGEEGYSEGVSTFGGSVKNEGKVYLNNLAKHPSNDQLRELLTEGNVFVNNVVQYCTAEIMLAATK